MEPVLESVSDQLVAAQDHLMSFAMSLCKNKTMAEDLVQDTNLKVLQFQDQYKPGTKFKAWCFTIMRNNYYNIGRTFKRRGAQQPFDDGLLAIDPTPSPEQIVIDRDMLDHVTVCMNANLSDNRRRAIEIVADGGKYNDIMKELDVAEGTAKSTVFRAREILAKVYNG